ncbi:hypothetical protein PsorP6_008270 [Peronosclerospora sorghi]|uniref:Uncharacterized protein n=1 Tax=Peronosclerospora sorghi TaxID=230839 RepID=A0ACC0W8D2_9STRA|nr:hypothetical protein PsorP6_008270 [Peronosclerospora sorghi]
MLETHRKLLNTALSSNLVLSCALLLDTIFLHATPFVGFNAAATASTYIIFTFVALVILNKTPSAFSIGFLVGASILILALAFQEALYWTLETFSTSQCMTAGYLAAVIHVLIFSLQCLVTIVVVKSKEDVIDTYAAYEYIPDIDTRLSTSSSPLTYQTTVPITDI